jgi:hypothetical protein
MVQCRKKEGNWAYKYLGGKGGCDKFVNKSSKGRTLACIFPYKSPGQKEKDYSLFIYLFYLASLNGTTIQTVNQQCQMAG